MKLKLILSAALIASVISAQAATSGATNNASKADAMTTLFGDPVIAKGRGFEIKRSDLDTVVTGAKANAAAQGQMLPPGFDISILNQLITIQLLVQKATPADRAAGVAVVAWVEITPAISAADRINFNFIWSIGLTSFV